MYAEFVACYEATGQVNWLKKFIPGLKIIDDISRPLKLYCDNEPAVIDPLGPQRPRWASSHTRPDRGHSSPFIAGGPPSHCAIKRRWGLAAQGTRFTVPPPPHQQSRTLADLSEDQSPTARMFRGYDGRGIRGRRGGRSFGAGRDMGETSDTSRDRQWETKDEVVRSGGGGRRTVAGFTGGLQRGDGGFRGGRGRGWPRVGAEARRGRAGAAGKGKIIEEGDKKKRSEEGGGGADEEIAEAGEDEGGLEQGVGIMCSRCTKRGHVAENAQDHVSHRCPLLKQSRPMAHAVGYAVHGLGFCHIPHPPLPRSKKEPKSAVISVAGGVLTMEQVVSQLQRIFLGKWTWELMEQEDNIFITNFPSKHELQRAIAFGGADVKEAGLQGLRLQFDVWVEKEEGFLLPKVWVRVYGIRKALREFMNLWAVGSMLGSTQTIQVAVLNPMLIPAHLDVVIGDHHFELEFEVERLGLDENGEEMEVTWRGGEDGREEEEEGEQEEDTANDRNPKRQKGSDGSGKEGDEQHIDQDMQVNNLGLNIPELRERLTAMSETDFEAFLREKANGILDGVVSEALDVLAEKFEEPPASEVEEEESVQSSEKETQVPETAVCEMDEDRDLAMHCSRQEGGGTIISRLEVGVHAPAAIPNFGVSSESQPKVG
ncbi:hypothetical protein GQ55_8G111200 [Panicum hallii var. hallii]|uniref:DUF4283 domain-containing protein n=1 Tax=Panicum hallii var. hallii TaxID=1504633 RepID=A0A2T7CMJ3_9POAL|nr:hypothetical protein GQ55_8G111200 [Panicum hallii var. hallii]